MHSSIGESHQSKGKEDLFRTGRPGRSGDDHSLLLYWNLPGSLVAWVPRQPSFLGL